MAKVHGGKKWERKGGWGCYSTRPHSFLHTAKTKYRNFESNIGNIGVSVPISTFMRLWVIYIFPPSVGLFCWRKYVDRSWDYINRSHTHECGNWGWGRAIYRKGIISGIFVAVQHASGWTDIFTDDVNGFPQPRIFASPPGANRIQAWWSRPFVPVRHVTWGLLSLLFGLSFLNIEFNQTAILNIVKDA